MIREGTHTFDVAWQKIKDILDPIDVTIIILFFTLYKPFLKGVYNLVNRVRKEPKEYSQSFVGYLEQPVNYHIWFLPFLYLLDIFGVVFHALGFSHDKILDKW